MNSSAGNNGLSGATLLGIVFVTLKLCGVVGWSWWWVTAPFWVPFVVVFAIIAVFAVFAVLGQISAIE